MRPSQDPMTKAITSDSIILIIIRFIKCDYDTHQVALGHNLQKKYDKQWCNVSYNLSCADGDHLLFPLKCKSIVILSGRGDG